MTDASANPSSSATPTATTPAAPRPNRPEIAFPEPILHVIPWDDPVVESVGHDPQSLYVERFWASVLGPSCLLLARRLSAGLEVSPVGFDLDTVAWAGELGLSVRGGKNGPFWKALDRCARFGVAKRNGSTLQVRRKISPLSTRQVERLPPHLKVVHETVTTTGNFSEIGLAACLNVRDAA